MSEELAAYGATDHADCAAGSEAGMSPAEARRRGGPYGDGRTPLVTTIRSIVVIVRESGGVYRARYGQHSASASCSAAVAAARCAAKALGLCPSRKPADMRMRDYYRIVGQGASTVRIRRMLDCPKAYEAMHDDGGAA